MFLAGASVYAQGDAADAVFYIHGGEVKIVVTSEQGKEAVVGMLAAGEFFGEGCLVGQPARLASSVVIADARITCVEKAEMVRALNAEPAFSEVFIAHLLTRKGKIEAELVDQLFNSSEKRLARALLLLANFGKARRAASHHHQGEPGHAGQHGRHYTFAHQFLHEQVPQARLHRI